MTETGLNPRPWPRLYTSRYQNRDAIIQSGLAPVGFTLGHRRFKLGYELLINLRELAPDGWFINEEDPEKFRWHYRQKLHRLTLQGVGGHLFRAVDVADPDLLPAWRGLVLLCFEDLSKPGEWCHRRLFAEWWQQQTGEEVPEL